MKVNGRRYVNVKTFKQSIGSCIIRDCRTSATVKAERIWCGMSMQVKLCAEHAKQGGVT